MFVVLGSHSQRFVKNQQQRAQAHPNDALVQRMALVSASDLLTLREVAQKHHVCQSKNTSNVAGTQNKVHW